MTNNRIYRKLNQTITFHTPDNIPITLHINTLAFKIEAEKISDCMLTLDVTFAEYQTIEDNILFNLHPHWRGPMMFGETFQPSTNLNLVCQLSQDMLPQLLEPVATIDEAIIYLQHINQHEPTHALLLTENWLATSVKQQQGAIKVGYIVTPQLVSPQTIQKENQTMDETPTLPNEDSTESEPLFATVQQFLEADNWPHSQVNEYTFSTGFQGENGQFACYAQVRETESQFVFYSVCSIKISPDRRTEVAEYLTRANYGMILGNFEMDFNDGEVRYKTSIDTEHDTLSYTLVKNVVYPNVMMMDKYLPGIMQVTYGGKSAAEAIEAIEG